MAKTNCFPLWDCQFTQKWTFPKFWVKCHNNNANLFVSQQPKGPRSQKEFVEKCKTKASRRNSFIGVDGPCCGDGHIYMNQKYFEPQFPTVFSVRIHLQIGCTSSLLSEKRYPLIYFFLVRHTCALGHLVFCRSTEQGVWFKKGHLTIDVLNCWSDLCWSM